MPMSLGLGLGLTHVGGNPFAAYTANGYAPAVVLDWSQNKAKGVAFSDLVHTRASNATQVASDGTVQWAPHNLSRYSEQMDVTTSGWFHQSAGVGVAPVVTANYSTAPNGTQTASRVQLNLNGGTTSGDYSRLTGPTISFLAGLHTRKIWIKLTSGTTPVTVRSSIAGGGAENKIVTEQWTAFDISWDASAGNFNSRLELIGGTGTSDVADILVWGEHVYRSDLGGMANNPARNDSYVPTTSAAVYLPRVENHIYSGGEWVKRGLIEPAATNLLLNSGTLSTQGVTVTAQAYTLHFTGTGTVTLSGASTAGPLVGTGTGENNRVSLTFTPSAGTLTLTVSGTVTNAQLETGLVPTSYIPTFGSTAFRDADTYHIPAEVLAGSVTTQGAEQWADSPSALGTGWTDNGDGSYTCDGTQAGNSSLSQYSSLTSGKSELCALEIVSQSAGTVRILPGGPGNATAKFSEVGTHSEIVVSDGSGIYVQADVNFVGTVRAISVTEITMPSAVSIAVKGEVSFGDEGSAAQFAFANWAVDGSNYISLDMDTDGAATGEVNFNQAETGTVDTVASASGAYSPGVNVAINIASEHSASRAQGAVDGSALTENATVSALADLTTADFQIAPSGVHNIERILIWADAIGDAGLEDTSG